MSSRLSLGASASELVKKLEKVVKGLENEERVTRDW